MLKTSVVFLVRLDFDYFFGQLLVAAGIRENWLFLILPFSVKNILPYQQANSNILSGKYCGRYKYL